LNVDLISFETICNHFLLFGALVKKKKFAKAMHLFGFDTTWSIWCSRNKIIFREDSIGVSDIYSG
jgi:hypothetical protein